MTKNAAARMAAFVAAAKTGDSPNAVTFAEAWAARTGEAIAHRTIARDIKYLRAAGADLYYDRANGGYIIANDWRMRWINVCGDPVAQEILADNPSGGEPLIVIRCGCTIGQFAADLIIAAHPGLIDNPARIRATCTAWIRQLPVIANNTPSIIADLVIDNGHPFARIADTSRLVPLAEVSPARRGTTAH